MEDDYKITQKDINSMLRYLNYHDPLSATKDNARFLLEKMMDDVELMARFNPEQLDRAKLGVDEESKRWKEIEAILKRKDI